ncbi:MAG: RHS repeat-associated core domain-containing protein [Bacteroidota bacterium]
MTHRLEKEEGLNRYGAATRYIYDGLGRTVRVESPDGFESRMEHGAWSESSHDPNDTIQDSFFYKSQVETGLLEGPELATIRKAEEHADTPTRSHLVPGGFPILQEEWLDEETALRTRSVPDAHGRVRHVLDPRTGEKALEQTFDVAGRVVWSRTPDSGERRTFFDAAGRPHLHWTAKDECLMTLYDDAWRVVSVERGAVGDPSDRTVLEQVIHGEAFPDREEAIERNLLGRVWKQKDPSGEVAYPRYDSRGNLLEKRRRLASQWRDELDWSGSVELEDREFVTRMVWDGLGREVGRTTPDGVYQSLEYQPSGDVGRIRIRKPDETEMQTILSGVEMDAAGRLNRVHYGNGVESVRSYEERSGRLKRLVSRENRNDEPDRTLQEMTFYWDPAGNLARKDDRTREHLLGHIPGIHNDQSRACDYTYDALYRLTKATGWTHLALQGGPQGGGPSSGWQGTRHFSLNDGGDLVPYERQYTYDLSGNLTRCRQTGDLSWTREMWVSDHSNRSLSNEWVERTPQTDPESRFDAAGNLRELEHLDGELQWGTRGELLKAVVIEREDGEPDAEHYRYGHDGMRLRRISERVEHGRTVLRETLWLDGCEIRREHRGDQSVLEKTSTTIEWNGQTVAVLDRLITDSLDRSDLDEGESRLRYHLCDHRGSVALELTDQAELISYEEFFPYGGSAFMAGSAIREASRKVYGYNGVEREDATGLCHIGYRSYAPWLCRWISPDPSGPADGLNLYAYLRNSPVQRVDPDGLNSSIAQDFEDNRGDFKELGTFYDYTGVRYYETYKHETHGYVGRYVGYMDSEGEYQEVDADEQPWLNEEQLRNLTSEARQNEADEEVNEADREGGVNESGASSEPDNEPPDPPDPDASDASDDTRNSSSAQSDTRVEEPNESETSTEPDSESADPNTSEPSDGTGNSSPEQSDTGAEQPNENSAVDENQGQPSSEESAIDSFKDSTSDARKAAGTPGKTMNTISQYFESLEQGAVDEQKRMEVLSRIERSEVESAGSRARHFQDAADRLQSEQVRIADELADARTDANMSKSALDQARMASKRADDRLADLVRNAMDTSGDPDWMVEHVSEDLRRETDMSDHRFGKAAEDYDRARANAPSDARLSALEDQHASAQSRLEEARRASRESGALSSARDEALSEARDASRQERQAARRSRAAQTGLSEAEGKLSRIRNGIQLKFGDGRMARLVEKVAPAARGVSKVLGPIGSAMSIHSLVTAENAGEVAQSLMDIGADVAGYVPHPLTMTFSLSYGATQLADSLSGGRISGGAAEATFQYDQFRGELLHGAASTVMEDPPPAYKMTAGWQIAGFLENRGIRF